MPLVRGLNKMGGSPLKIISQNNLNKLAVACTRGFFLAVLCGFLPPFPSLPLVGHTPAPQLPLLWGTGV